MYVIRKEGDKNRFHAMESNSGWAENPYPDCAVVPDSMAGALLATGGYCDLTLSEDGREVAGFEAVPPPSVPHVPTEAELMQMAIAEMAIAQQAQKAEMDRALAELSMLIALPGG